MKKYKGYMPALDLKEKICPICQKHFLYTSEHIYRVSSPHIILFCSWTCYRIYQKAHPKKERHNYGL